jgi:hypothetical protein
MRINYVVCFYITDNSIKFERNNLYHSIDKFYAVKCQIDALQSFNNPDVVKATFVVNKSDCVNVGDIETILSKYNNLKIPIEVKYRDNWGISYGAWEYHIRETINEDYDYYFLTEDDYCISNDKFYEAFHQKFTDKTAMVCGLYTNHPSVSYGLVSQKICKEILNDYKELFPTYNERSKDINNEYNHWQGYYHMNFLNAGYEIKDITDISPVLYRRFKYIITFSNGNYIDVPGYSNITPLL